MYDVDNGERGIPLFIIRVIGPSQPIDDSVIAQARMMAFALGVSTYVVTNGKQVKIWEGDITRSSLPVVDGVITAMRECWPGIESALAMEAFD